MRNGRLNWELTGFRQTTMNLLLSRTPAPSSGFTSQVFNGGEIRNQGVEVAVGYAPIQTATTTWTNRVTVTRYTSEVVDLAGLPAFFPAGSGFGNLGRTRIEEGKSITQIIGFGLAEDGTRDSQLRELGNSAPDFRMGFSSDLFVGRLSLTTVVDWQQGGSAINLTKYLQDAAQTTADWGEPSWEERYQRNFLRGDHAPGGPDRPGRSHRPESPHVHRVQRARPRGLELRGAGHPREPGHCPAHGRTALLGAGLLLLGGCGDLEILNTNAPTVETLRGNPTREVLALATTGIYSGTFNDVGTEI